MADPVQNATQYSQHVEHMDSRTEDLKDFLEALIAWVPRTEAEEILDVGCGSGVFTVEHLAPAFPGAKIVAADISEGLISIALKERRHKDVTFQVFDIENRNGIPEEWKGRFSKVVSFHCLHWVKDLPTSIKNIRSAVKDDGYFATDVGVDFHTFEEAISKMQANEKWKKYFPEDIKSKYAMLYGWGAADRLGYFKKTLEDTGFEIVYSKIKTLNTVLSDNDVIETTETAMFQFTHEMNKIERQNFYSDYIQALLSTGSKRNEAGEIVFPGDMLWIAAKAV